MSKQNTTQDMEVIREYTLPVTEFTYVVVRLENGKEITYGKKVYDEMTGKRKK